MPSPGPSRVDYAASSPPWHRRRRGRRALLVMGLIAVAGSALWWGFGVGRHVTLLRLQQRCMAYRHPSTLAVFEEDPQRAAQLLAADSRYSRLHASASPVGISAPEWNALYESVSPHGVARTATLFVHERRNAGGRTRIVAVVLGRWSMLPEKSLLFVSVRVLRPGTLVSPPALLFDDMPFEQLPGQQHGSTRIYAGQADPADASHFTIDYDIVAPDRVLRVTLDGWLRDDDTVALQLRGPDPDVTPLPPASPASLPSAGPAAAGPASRASR
jgi:hypothetical protein